MVPQMCHLHHHSTELFWQTAWEIAYPNEITCVIRRITVPSFFLNSFFADMFIVRLSLELAGLSDNGALLLKTEDCNIRSRRSSQQSLCSVKLGSRGLSFEVKEQMLCIGLCTCVAKVDVYLFTTCELYIPGLRCERMDKMRFAQCEHKDSYMRAEYL